LAGIWSQWKSPTGKIIHSAAIITRESVGTLAGIHHRMPVLMPRDRWQQWLDPAERDTETLISLMEFPAPDAGLTPHPVSVEVNKVANNGVAMTAPIVLGEQETLF
jgi:hypothetical protein